MKTFALILFIVLGFGGANGQKSKCVPTTTPPRDERVRLQLTTSIAEARYSVENGSRRLLLSLNLHYRNLGTRPILLDKKNSRIYRRIVSKNLKAVATCNYLHDISSHFIGQSLQARDPEQSAFIIIKPGESVSFEGKVGLSLYDGAKDTKDELHPGNYVLQLRIAAWAYVADPAEWEQKWGGEAYLWDGNVTSDPMAFTVEKL